MTNKKEDYNVALKELDAQIAPLEKLREGLEGKIPDLSDLDMSIELLREQRADIVRQLEEVSRTTHIIELKIDGITYRQSEADGDMVNTFINLTKSIDMEVATDLTPTQRMREWLMANGYAVGSRGKISDSLRAKYEAAHAKPEAPKAPAKKGGRHATVRKDKELQAAA